MRTSTIDRPWLARAGRGHRIRGAATAATVLLVTLAGAAPAARAAADESAQPMVTVGSRVRVSAPGVATYPVVGTVRALDPQSLTLEVSGKAEPLLIPRDGIRRLDVSLGRRSRGIDILIGALVGAGAGALVAHTTHSSQQGLVQSADTAVGALGGMLVGAGVGALIPPGDHWRETSPSRLSVRLAPARDRAPGLVAIAYAF